jgi:hypothetical protein
MAAEDRGLKLPKLYCSLDRPPDDWREMAADDLRDIASGAVW